MFGRLWDHCFVGIVVFVGHLLCRFAGLFVGVVVDYGMLGDMVGIAYELHLV